VRLENSSHEDARTTAPDAGLDEVPGNRSLEDVFHAEPDVLEPAEPDHCCRLGRPVQSVLSSVRIEWQTFDDFQVDGTKEPR
jgi:hypothetical protein